MLPVVHYHVINFFLEFAKSRTTEIQRKYLVGLNPVHSQGSSSKQKLLKFSNNKINQLQSSELATIKIVNTQKSLWRISTACLNLELLDLNQITLSLRQVAGLCQVFKNYLIARYSCILVYLVLQIPMRNPVKSGYPEVPGSSG